MRSLAADVATSDDDVDSVTGETSVLQAYLEVASVLRVNTGSALKLAAQLVGATFGPATEHSWPYSDLTGTQPTQPVYGSTSTDISSIIPTRHAYPGQTSSMQGAAQWLTPALGMPLGVDRYNRGFFLKDAANSGMDPSEMLQRVMKLLLSARDGRVAGRVGCGDLPLRLLEPVSPELQRLLVLHASAVRQALQPPVGLEHPAQDSGSAARLVHLGTGGITQAEAAILGLEQIKNSPRATLLPSAATFDGMHLTMAGLCAALIAFDHGMDFVASPAAFPVLRACRTQLQTQPSRMSSSSAGSAGTVDGMSVSRRTVNDGLADEGGDCDDRSVSHTVPLAVLFSRFPHLPRLLTDATDADCDAAKDFLRRLREAPPSVEAKGGAPPSNGCDTKAGFTYAQGLPSVGVRGIMRQHLHCVDQPVLQIVFRPPYTATHGSKSSTASSGVPFECFANEALCRVAGIQVQDVANDMAGDTAARPRISTCFDGHPKTRLARVLAALAASAAGQDSYQFEGMFLRFTRAGSVPGGSGQLLASSMYGVETRHIERYLGGSALCMTSYLSDLVMAHDMQSIDAIDVPGGELRTIEALMLHGSRYPDVQRAMAVHGASDAATALWRTFDFSCRQLTMRALGLVQLGGSSANGPPYKAVDNTAGHIISSLLQAHVRRGGSFPPSAYDISALLGDPQLDHILAAAFQSATGPAIPTSGEQREWLGLAAVVGHEAYTQEGPGSEDPFKFEHVTSESHGLQSAASKDSPPLAPPGVPWDASLRYADSEVARMRGELSFAVGGGLLRELAGEALSQVSIMIGAGSVPVWPDAAGGGAPVSPSRSQPAVTPPASMGFALQVHVGKEVVHMRRSLKGGRLMQHMLALAAQAAHMRSGRQAPGAVLASTIDL